MFIQLLRVFYSLELSRLEQTMSHDWLETEQSSVMFSDRVLTLHLTQIPNPESLRA